MQGVESNPPSTSFPTATNACPALRSPPQGVSALIQTPTPQTRLSRAPRADLCLLPRRSSNRTPLYKPQPASRFLNARPSPLPPLSSRPIHLHAPLTIKYGTHTSNALVVQRKLTRISQSGKGKAYASIYTKLTRRLLTFNHIQWQVLFWQGWW